MKLRTFALCGILLAFGLAADRVATAEEAVVPTAAAQEVPALIQLPGAATPACDKDAESARMAMGIPEWLDAAGCCPRTCNLDSECDVTCGPGLGRCAKLGSCCSFCLCTLGGS